MRRFVLCLIAVALGNAEASSLEVRVSGAVGNSVPEIDYLPDSGMPLEIVLAIVNELGESSLPILSWQISLQTVATSGATGSVAFQALSSPDSPIFRAEPGPLPLNDLPDTSVVVTDVDPDFSGVVLGPGESADTVRIHLLPSEAATGTFILTLGPYDSENEDQSSLWIDAEEFAPHAFFNAPAQSGMIELARLNVMEGDVSPFGDFNGDLSVDAADYTVWRDGLGSKFVAEQFGIWKEHFGSAIVSNPVPEPATTLLLAPCLTLFSSRTGVRVAARRRTC